MVATIGLDFIAQFVFRSFQNNVSLEGITFAAPKLPIWLAWIPGLHPGGQAMVIDSETRWYWVLLVLAVVTAVVLKNVVRGRHGRMLVAIREKDRVAELLGVDVLRSKVVIFALTSGFVSLSGALAAYHTAFVSTNSFNINIVLTYALMIAIGGFGSIVGAFWGALFVLGLPFVLDWLFQNVAPFSHIVYLSTYGADVEQVIFAVILIVLLIVKSRKGSRSKDRNLMASMGRSVSAVFRRAT